MLTGLTPADAARQPRGTVVRSIQVVENGGITHVTIDADGPLPLPLSESLQNPPRIYFDLAGVTHKVSATTVVQRGGVVGRVRVALRPEKVTRVVLDLTRLESYRVIADNYQAGRLRVLIGSDPRLMRSLRRAGRFGPRLRPRHQNPQPRQPQPPGPLERRHPRRRPPTPPRRSWKALAPLRRSRPQRWSRLRQVEVPCCLLRRRDRRSRRRRSWPIANRSLPSLRGSKPCECSSPESTRARTSVPTLWCQPRRSSRSFAAPWKQCGRPFFLPSFTIC